MGTQQRKKIVDKLGEIALLACGDWSQLAEGPMMRNAAKHPSSGQDKSVIIHVALAQAASSNGR